MIPKLEDKIVEFNTFSLSCFKFK